MKFQIEKIKIGFAKRAKVVDMKQLKKCCWSLINQKKLDVPETIEIKDMSIDGEHCKTIPFHDVLSDLPKVLTKTMSENMSVPLAFYSVLHLSNEHSLFLIQHMDLQDFDIITPE